MLDLLAEYTNYAKRKMPDLPDNWLVYHAVRNDDGSVYIEGALAEEIRSGPRQGMAMWTTPKQMHRALVIPPREPVRPNDVIQSKVVQFDSAQPEEKERTKR